MGDVRSAKPASFGLISAFRERTAALHRQAERGGIVQAILRAQVTRGGYALFLRNLLPAYREMERGLERHRCNPGIALIADRAVYRTRAIESDLAQLCGPTWDADLPLLAAGRRYAARAAAAAEDDGRRMLAHAYVRYLGDLNGGQVLRHLLARTLGLDQAALAFHHFPAVDDLAAFKIAYRDSFDRAADAIPRRDDIVDEAEAVFLLNIDVSTAVHSAAGRLP